MTENTTTQSINIQSIKAKAIAVITNPVEFFRSMHTTGGFKDPLIFMVAISLVTGVVRAIFTIFSSFGIAVSLLVLTPILTAIFGFVGAAIAYVIWKLMGSSHNYETAYRCVAYASAIAPITTLISFVPYLGGVAATAWGFYLIYVASVETHRIPIQKAKLVWGILFLVIALLGISAETGNRRMHAKFSELQEQMNEEDMTPEQAGQFMGEFLKGLEKGAQTNDR